MPRLRRWIVEATRTLGWRRLLGTGGGRAAALQRFSWVACEVVWQASDGGEIDEKSFVAKGAPLHDGQKRRRECACVFVTANYSAPPVSRGVIGFAVRSMRWSGGDL